MAGSLISGYGIGDVDFTKLMNSADAQRIGFHSLTLTEYDTDTKPAIAAGSKVEVNGGLYKFDTEEAISGSPSAVLVNCAIIGSCRVFNNGTIY